MLLCLKHVVKEVETGWLVNWLVAVCGLRFAVCGLRFAVNGDPFSVCR